MADDDDRAHRDARTRDYERLQKIARLLGLRVEDFFDPAVDDGSSVEPPHDDDDR